MNNILNERILTSLVFGCFFFITFDYILLAWHHCLFLSSTTPTLFRFKLHPGSVQRSVVLDEFSQERQPLLTLFIQNDVFMATQCNYTGASVQWNYCRAGILLPHYGSNQRCDASQSSFDVRFVISPLAWSRMIAIMCVSCSIQSSGRVQKSFTANILTEGEKNRKVVI